MSQFDEDYSRLRNLVVGFVPSSSDLWRFCVFMFVLAAALVSWGIALNTGWAYVGSGWWWLLKWPLLVVALAFVIRRIFGARTRRGVHGPAPSMADERQCQPPSFEGHNNATAEPFTPRKPSLAEVRSTAPPTEIYDDEFEELIEKCLEVIRQEQRASTSLLQRRLDLSFEQALRVIGVLVQRSILGTGKGAQPRDILVDLNAPV